MGFQSGSVSFRSFKISSGPSTPSEQILENIRSGAIQLTAIGVPPEVEAGFCAGRHANDLDFTFENNVFGDAIIFGFRVDTNKVPADVKKAVELAERDAVAASNPSGFISKLQKKEIKEKVRHQLDEERKTGKHRKSRVIPVLWDLAHNVIYSPVTGKTADLLIAKFCDILHLDVTAVSAGSLASSLAESAGLSSYLESVTPAPLLIKPGFPEPVYPWFAKQPDTNGFLGNEFALYLWYVVANDGGTVQTGATSEAAFLIDRCLEVSCAFTGDAKDTFRGTGPHTSPEAWRALSSGKTPRKFGLVMEGGGEQYSLTFNPETFAVSGLKLPEIEADTFVQRVIARVEAIDDANGILANSYLAFLKIRFSDEWTEVCSKISAWAAAGLTSTQQAGTVTESA